MGGVTRWVDASRAARHLLSHPARRRVRLRRPTSFVIGDRNGIKGMAMRQTTRRFLWIFGVAALGVAALAPIMAQGRGGGGSGGGSKPDHKARQARPIMLGVSGGNATDSANGFCCSGTLGALVTDGSEQFILSNSHVFAHDIAGPDQAEVDDPINQSGLVDVSCQNNSDDYVGHLATLSTINPGFESVVDASLASVLPGMVDPNGAILEIGTISSTPVDAFLGQSVKKSGRTTGLTSSRIEALDATVSVGYTNECGGAQYTSTFTGQIIVGNRGSKFIAGGDSGSLMVENAATNPRAVGLLFAGSSSIAIANPIGDVLTRFGVTLVGQSGTSAASEAPNASLEQGVVHARAAKARNVNRLVSVPGAIGHAVGFNANGPVIKVYVAEMTARARQNVPAQIEGVPVELEETGPIIAIGSMLPCGKKR